MKNQKIIAEYLYNNYFQDCSRLARVQIISALINHANTNEIPSLIDKIAILNGIEKSYPPEVEVVIVA